MGVSIISCEESHSGEQLVCQWLHFLYKGAFYVIYYDGKMDMGPTPTDKNMFWVPI